MSLPEVKRKNVKKADDVKQGIKKGVEPSPENFASGKTQERCRNCRITAINGINFPPGKNTARVNITENTALFTLTSTPNPETCPCKWSEVGVEYVAVLTGAAKILKRKSFTMPQIIELIKIDPNNSNNPYFTINNCQLSMKIKDLNTDLRNGINAQHAFFQGVPMSITVKVKCNSHVRTIVVEITDP